MLSASQSSLWSARLTTKLRLLLDECLHGPLAEEIGKYTALNVEYINETLLANCGLQDDSIVAYAKQTSRIVVTPEGRFNEHKFTICTHPGILVFKATKRHDVVKATMFRDLMMSGVRARCQHAVTYLKLDDTATRTIAIFKERDGQGQIQTTMLDLKHMSVEKRQPDFQKPKCRY